MHDLTITPVYTFVQGRTRTWVVRAEASPFNRMLQSDDGIVLVKEAPPRPPQQRHASKWAPLHNSKQPVKFPSTWAEVAQATKKMQGASGAGQQGQEPMFTKGKDLSIQEVSGAHPEHSAVAAASSAAPATDAESSIAAAVGKIDELLASLRRLEGRVDGITTEIAGLKGVGIGEDTMLTDGEDDRDSELQGRRKTLRIR